MNEQTGPAGPEEAAADGEGNRRHRVVRAQARPTGGTDVRRLVEQAVRQQSQGNAEEAAQLYRRILTLDPYVPAAWINLGVLLRRAGWVRPAIACLKRGVALKPYDGSAWSNLGNALRGGGRYEEAVRAQQRALELSSGTGQLHYNLALAQRDLGHLDEALHAFRRAEMLGYDRPELVWDRSLTLLLLGDFRAGFEAYEARWKLAESASRHADVPAWDGGALEAGKTLLVWCEQGLGDTLHFARYLPLLKARGVERIVFEVQGPLARLIQKSARFKDIIVVARGAPLPAVDAAVPLLSLPRLFGTTLDDIPADIPYLAAPSDIAAPVLPEGALNVGLCWAGKPSHRNDRNRSIGAASFVDLLDMPGATFHSLQKGPGARQIRENGLGALVEDLGSRMADFAETAAALKRLDLVITVDTSIAHLAGAMGKPVWVLLPYAPDWRWLLHRDDSPWYPSMTLFRQTSPGDWDEVMERVRAALGERIAETLKTHRGADA